MIRKQTATEPLFPEIEWEMPQNKRQRGSLLIVGGSPHGFASVANSYEYARTAGVGEVRLLLPSSTEQVIKGLIDNAGFLPSTPSGSFSKRGLSELKDHAAQASATLLAGEFGRNSETSSLIEGFLMSFPERVVLSKDAVDYAIASYPKEVLNRDQTMLVASLSQLQKLLMRAGLKENIKFEMGLDQVAHFLEGLSTETAAIIITMHHKHLFVAHDSQVTLTPLGSDELLWQTKVASYAAVFWLQHPTKPVPAITSAIFESIKA